MLSQCLQVIIDCIERHVLNSNQKLDIRSESVNRIYVKLQHLKTYKKLPNSCQHEMLEKLLQIGNKFG